MSKWLENLDKVLNIAKTSQTTEEVAERCSKLLAEDITYNAVSAALRRLRRDHGLDLPIISDVLGSELGGFSEDQSFSDLLVKLPAVRKGPDVYTATVELPFIPRKLAVIPDLHFPIQDKKAVDLTIAFLQDYKPDAIVLLGDVLDCSCLSRHETSHVAEKLMDIKYKLSFEIEEAKPFIKELLSISKNEVSWIEGNHEIRRKNIINKNPGLIGHKSLEPKEFFEIPKQVRWVENDQRLKIGPAYFEHGDNIINSRGSQHIAAALGQRRPWCSTFVGHYHCCSEYTRVAYMPDGTPEAFTTATCGHLSDFINHKYVNLPNWIMGLRTLEFWLDGTDTRFSTHQIKFINNKFSYNGKLYK